MNYQEGRNERSDSETDVVPVEYYPPRHYVQAGTRGVLYSITGRQAVYEIPPPPPPPTTTTTCDLIVIRVHARMIMMQVPT